MRIDFNNMTILTPRPPKKNRFTKGLRFVRGSDVKLEKEDPELLVFGEAAATPNDVAYSGAVDVSALPELLRDLRPLPECMDPMHLPAYPDRDPSMLTMLWASNGDVDSGLHYDENSGGFLMQVTGRKEIVMFPPSDSVSLLF